MGNYLRNMAKILKSIGDEKRLKIIKMLASNADEIFCVSDIAERLGISQPAASQHIRVLKDIGILDENRKGFRVFYTINSEVMAEYLKEIEELFTRAFEKCPYNFSCADCPYHNKCQ
ncbi:hypothetical protein SRRS_35440 [Sporomusa rhizae]|uniref:ArsR/SmtB family transcription factor n=1 Tax=Sporomusa rhizae TaxID=357999 RepID=UPI00352A709F